MFREIEMLGKNREKGRLGRENNEEISSFFIQLGRIEEKVDNLSNKMSFEHGHIKEDTAVAVRAINDMSPTLVELENLRAEILSRVSELENPVPAPEITFRGRTDKVSEGILGLLGEGTELSVTGIAGRIKEDFPEYKDNSLRVVVSRRLNRLVSDGKIQARDFKNKKLYCRKA